MAVRSHNQKRYDLHTHSIHSDGTNTPTEIAREVSRLGLGGFSLTDHDTANGWTEARQAAAKYAIDFVPGMELTTTFGGRSTHLLAYGVKPGDSELEVALEDVRRHRETRAEQMVDRLKQDFDLSWDAIFKNQTITIGRPHIADELVRLGHVRDRNEAFEKLLGPGSKYYVPTKALETREAIELVQKAGGAPVLAHPAAVRHQNSISPLELAELIEAGLVGIELEHPENVASRVPELQDEATRLGLLVTGSSDFHGTGKTNRLGECSTPKQVVDQLREHMRVKR